MKDQIFNLIAKEHERQINNIELIASENYVSKDVLEAQGSILTNKYAEWYPTKRYYGGCENVDKVEQIAIDLAQEIFKTDYQVNVQPHSWSSANMWVYLSVLKPGDTILWMSLNSWGHLTHWAYPSFSWNKFWIFNSISYTWDNEWFLDYKQIEELALEHKPKIIVAWASAYSREINFKIFKKIADKVWAYLLVDMAHIAWLIVAWEHQSPFWIADFVTTTTHKTLRWPRGWVIFSKTEELWKKVNSTIFPWIQWGPLEHIIAAKAICFNEALTDNYKNYIREVRKNAKIFEKLILEEWKIDNKEIKIVTWWTDNHLLLLDFRDLELTWVEVEEELEKVNITVNKNTVPGDLKPMNPSWIRIWTPAITSRNISEKWIKKIARNLINSILTLYKYKNDIITEEEYLNTIELIKHENIRLVHELSIFLEV